MKFTKEFTQENRNRKFWVVRADKVLVATYIWSEKLADLLVVALTDLEAKNRDMVVAAIDEARDS